MPRILLDAGPLVAALDRNDAYYRWAVPQFAALNEPLLTCEPVLTEACHLVRHLPGGADAVFALLKAQVMRVEFRIASEWPILRRLMRKYRDLPMSLADACLVRMAELHAESRILTIDSHFRRYRKNRRQVIPLLIPEDRR